MKYWRLLPGILIGILPMAVQGQQTLALGQNNYDNRKGIIYDKEVSVDFRVHTNGMSLGMNFGQIKTYYRTRYFHIDFGELRNSRETRQNKNIQAGGPNGSFRSFVYGKQNNFYALRGGLGEKLYLSEKGRRKGLAVGISYEAGPTLGLLKPYYLILRNVSENPSPFTTFRSEKFTSANEARFLDINSIFGADSFTRGFGELGVVPGAHAKFAMHFDWGAFDEFVKAFEVGLMADFFFRSVPIMVESDLIKDSGNTPVFINLFLNLQLGKRS